MGSTVVANHKENCSFRHPGRHIGSVYESDKYGENSRLWSE